MIKAFTACLFCLLIFEANAQKTNHDYSILNFEVQFMRTGNEGTTLFKVISIGRNSEQAINNAKADAIKAVLFKGIPNSDLSKPLISTQEMFNNHFFFSDFFEKEKYLDYIHLLNDGEIAGEDRIKVNGKYKIGLIVSVQKARLRTFLENERIIKSLNSGF
jgi:hypothetical protein